MKYAFGLLVALAAGLAQSSASAKLECAEKIEFILLDCYRSAVTLSVYLENEPLYFPEIYLAYDVESARRRLKEVSTFYRERIDRGMIQKCPDELTKVEARLAALEKAVQFKLYEPINNEDAFALLSKKLDACDKFTAYFKKQSK